MEDQDMEYAWDEEVPKAPKKAPVKSGPHVKLDQRVQYEGRFIIRGEECYFRDNSGKEYLVEGPASRFISQQSHELMVTAILRDPRQNPAIIRVLSFI